MRMPAVGDCGEVVLHAGVWVRAKISAHCTECISVWPTESQSYAVGCGQDAPRIAFFLCPASYCVLPLS